MYLRPGVLDMKGLVLLNDADFSQVHYWEPAWLNNTSLGSACNDAILFTADYSDPAHTVGYSRPSVNMFKD
jgi:hypothetical protein